MNELLVPGRFVKTGMFDKKNNKKSFETETLTKYRSETMTRASTDPENTLRPNFPIFLKAFSKKTFNWRLSNKKKCWNFILKIKRTKSRLKTLKARFAWYFTVGTKKTTRDCLNFNCDEVGREKCNESFVSQLKIVSFYCHQAAEQPWVTRGIRHPPFSHHKSCNVVFSTFIFWILAFRRKWEFS